MFPRKTVFVVGAGASDDLGLPIGNGLRDKLIAVLDRGPGEDNFTYDHFNKAVHALCGSRERDGWRAIFTDHIQAGMKIVRGLPLAISIDNYLDAHRNNEAIRSIGKIAIATAILDAERDSALYSESSPQQDGVDLVNTGNNPRLHESWYLPLMRLVASGQSVDKITSLFENIAFIAFNYDRCLEQFFVNAVQAYFNVSFRAAIDCVNQLVIIHPYGQVGHLPWQAQSLTARFGNPDADLVEIAKGIQTFTESANAGVIADVRDMVRSAETLVFMGYGFLDQNNDLLRARDSQVRRVFATSLGISDSDVPIMKEEICRIVGKQEARDITDKSDRRCAEIFIERGSCRDLMDNHRFRLARAPMPAIF